jgi:hypothetical protein
MTASRHRKQAAKNLGIALTADYRRLLQATSEDEIVAASVTLGQNFNTNIEFICWVLKEYGGVQQMPFQPTRPAAPKISNDLH